MYSYQYMFLMNFCRLIEGFGPSQEFVGIDGAFSLRWFSLCSFLAALHNMYCVVIAVTIAIKHHGWIWQVLVHMPCTSGKLCFSGAETQLWWDFSFGTLFKVDCYWKNNISEDCVFSDTTIVCHELICSSDREQVFGISWKTGRCASVSR